MKSILNNNNRTAAKLGYSFSELNLNKIPLENAKTITIKSCVAEMPSILTFTSPGADIYRCAIGYELTLFAMYNYWFGAKSPEEALHNIADMVQGWLHVCTETHMSCRSSGQSYYPTRLVQVSDNKIRLVCTSDSPKPVVYTTLSHCWGTLNIIQLKRSNISRFQTIIPKTNYVRLFAKPSC